MSAAVDECQPGSVPEEVAEQCSETQGDAGPLGHAESATAADKGGAALTKAADSKESSETKTRVDSNDAKPASKYEKAAEADEVFVAPYATSYEIGQDNIQRYGMDVHPRVFFPAGAIALMFIIASLIVPEEMGLAMADAKLWCITNFDWFFIVSVDLMLLVCLLLVCSPLGKIRLGGDQAKPEFGMLTWFGMLFAAGMGIGLMFWMVAEPMAYYTNWWGTPLNVEPRTEDARWYALAATLYHWGLHAWAIYAVVALTLAFFRFNKGLPLTLRSGLFPLFGDRAWGALGDVIDVISVLCTLFGLATSLGFGAQQAAAGLNYLFEADPGVGTQIAIICCVTAVATISVVRGLDGGVKVLSNFNMGLALCMFIFVFFAGPSVKILESWVLTLWTYAKLIGPLSNAIGREDTMFYHDWTVFYWAWWVSWAPFVGMFIARISRGRTIREFLAAVLIVPVLVTLTWMSVFGGSALEQAATGVAPLGTEGLTSTPLTLFQMLSNLPAAGFTSFVGIVLVLVFFVTSSDSGSLVVDSLTAGGKLDAPVPQRIFWAVCEGATAIALLVGGGADSLGAMQTVTIIAGLPFTAVLLMMTTSLILGLKHEHDHHRATQATPTIPV